MQKFSTKGVCSREIQFEIEDDRIKHLQFIQGCPGNTLGIASLVKGMKIEEAIEKLKGIDCRGKGTSCPDQFAIALEEYTQNKTK